MPETIDIPHELLKPNGVEKNTEPNIIFLSFADSSIPVFKEDRNKDYVKYGANNYYSEYLTYLFNKSAKHNAIITGKANYIFGNGYENGNLIVNRLNESLNDIAKKCILDARIYGGFKLEIIWNKVGRVSEIYHADYCSLRKAKDGGFFFKEWWASYQNGWTNNYREQEEFINEFNPQNPVGSQIFEYNEYRPGLRYYPLPDYIGCLNYIETDIEISKYYLSAIRNGMMPSKMIQFFKGDPPDEKKKEIEKRFSNKFAGAENAGKFIMVFNDSNATKSVEVSDLSATELDKQFIELNKTTQQEIFSGHLVTSPMLFGIKTEGQLGGSTELNIAYSIFQNTYSKPKADAFDKEINWLLSYSVFKADYKLQSTSPVGLQFDVKDVINSLPKAFVFKELGIPEEMWNTEQIAPNGQSPIQINAPGAAAVNDNIKNLTGRQMQGIQRIVRQYESQNNPMTRAQAALLLKTGYGLTDEDIIAFLGELPLAASFEEIEDSIIAMFDVCGESKEDFEVVKSKKVCFSSDNEMIEDEKIYIQEAFQTYSVTQTENSIIELIKKDAKITPEVIAKAISQTVAYVESKIASLSKRGYIETSIEKVGSDEIANRSVPPEINIKPPPTTKYPLEISIKYSYEGPQDSRNRPFCAKLMQLSRLYSRFDIEQISQRLGYSVFDRRGGFWRHSDGEVTPYCRHHWKSNIVVKKGGTQ